MRRRDFLRTFITVAIAPRLLLSQQTPRPVTPPPAPVPWTLGLNPKTPLPHTAIAEDVTEAELHFFSARQMATLTRLADALLPPYGGKPGAIEAETPQFMDFLIGASPDARKQVYSGGLDWLEAESHKKYDKPFSDLDGAQADAILKPWLRTWMLDHPPTEAHADFINIAHDEMRTATYNSKVWSDAPYHGAEGWTETGLYWSPIEPDMQSAGAACAQTPPHVQAAPKASHPMPTYPR